MHYHAWLRIVLELLLPLLELKVCAIVPGSSSEILQGLAQRTLSLQDNFGFVSTQLLSTGFCFLRQGAISLG